MNDEILISWEQLLDMYFNDPSLSDELCAEIQQALADETFETEKSTVLGKYFDGMVYYDPKPDANTLSRLEDIKVALGFPDPDSPEYKHLDTDVRRMIPIEETSPEINSGERVKCSHKTEMLFPTAYASVIHV